MTEQDHQKTLNEMYRSRFLEFPGKPEAVHYSNSESQTVRFAKLAEIGDLRGKKILDLGCGQGDFYAFLKDHFGDLNYTGIDLVQEMIAYAQDRHPEGRFLCHNVLETPLDEKYDYVLLCGIFNIHPGDCASFARQMLETAFASCTIAMGFNFISSYHNYTDPRISYHDPVEMTRFCIEKLSRKIDLFHHHARADASVFVYR